MQLGGIERGAGMLRRPAGNNAEWSLVAFKCDPPHAWARSLVLVRQPQSVILPGGSRDHERGHHVINFEV